MNPDTLPSRCFTSCRSRKVVNRSDTSPSATPVASATAGGSAKPFRRRACSTSRSGSLQCVTLSPVLLEATVHRVDAAEQRLPQRFLLRGVERLHHGGLHLADVGVAGGEGAATLGREPGLQNAAMLGMGPPAHEAALLQGEEHLVGRLR